MTTLDITHKAVRPSFSYRILCINTPTRMINPPPVNLDLQMYPKETTPTNIYRQEFSRLLVERYSDYLHVYTDGSKTVDGVGAAAVCEATSRSATLPKEASVFSAEIYALELATSIIKTNGLPKNVIFSDSLSALVQLKTLHYTHPALRKLQHDLFTLSEENQAVELCWIPGHAGIRGNERADALAKLASTHQEQFITIHYRDWFPIIDSLITSRWNEMWQ
jgi:ribonuclease HI